MPTAQPSNPQLCCCPEKAARANRWLCSDKTFLIRAGAGPDLAVGYSLATLLQMRAHLLDKLLSKPPRIFLPGTDYFLLLWSLVSSQPQRVLKWHGSSSDSSVPEISQSKGGRGPGGAEDISAKGRQRFFASPSSSLTRGLFTLLSALVPEVDKFTFYNHHRQIFIIKKGN